MPDDTHAVGRGQRHVYTLMNVVLAPRYLSMLDARCIDASAAARNAQGLATWDSHSECMARFMHLAAHVGLQHWLHNFGIEVMHSWDCSPDILKSAEHMCIVTHKTYYHSSHHVATAELITFQETR